jgi:general L-amino acid transport system permease protein
VTIDAVAADRLLVAMPEPARPPSAGPRDWVRRNLFGSVGSTIVTIVAAPLLAYVLFRLGRFVFVTGRWEIVERNLVLYMVGQYPRDELWRIGVALAGVAGFAGLLAGFLHHRQVATGRAGPPRPPARRIAELFVRTWPFLLGVAVLLSLTTTVGPWLVAGGMLVAAVGGRLAGELIPRRAGLALAGAGLLLTAALAWLLTAGAPWDDWGGLMLNVVLAALGIALSFPLGVLFALGRQAGRRTNSVAGGVVVGVLLAALPLTALVRRGFDPAEWMTWVLVALITALAIGGFRLGRGSTLPLVRVLSIGYIEFFRGVPLYVLLFLGYLGLQFFLPAGTDPPSNVVRATVVFTVFTAAYLAEIVRGGLQSLPRGQTEAAQALGLSPVRVQLLIVLPQALRNVIPAIVGQFISLFKDTTLAGAAVQFLEILKVGETVPQQPDFRGQGLFAESLTFVMFVFWVGCITMSRESQRLERKLGVGVR